MIKVITPFMKKYRWTIILCQIRVIGEVLMEISIPVLMSKIVGVGDSTKKYPLCISIRRNNGADVAVLPVVRRVFHQIRRDCQHRI